MKTLKLFGMALMAVLMCVNFASCSHEDIVENQQPQKYTISLACVGEVLDVNQELLARSTEPYNLYEIQIYSDGTPYANGIFDDITGVTVDLLDGKTYDFKVVFTVNATFRSPTNKFNYSTSNDLLAPSGSGYYRTWDVYYGKFNNYTPTSNESVEIYMKRMSTGFKFEANNLSDGASVKIKLKRTSYENTTESPAPLTYEAPEVEKIYSFQGNYDEVYKGVLEEDEYVNYYETNYITITLTRIDGIEVDLGTHEIIAERNKKTCVTIHIDEIDSMISNGITITQEEEEMTDGKQYEVDGEEGTITEVTIEG